MSESETEPSGTPSGHDDEPEPEEVGFTGPLPNDPDSVRGSGQPQQLGVQANEPDLVEKQDPGSRESKDG